jgi:hypothetical protein
VSWRNVRRLAAALLVTAAAQSQEAAPAAGRKPAVPPGRDPGGLAVAVLSTGVDYTLPELAARLARDGEGELIGWDFIDGDRQPFAPRGQPQAWTLAGQASELALRVAGSDRRIVPLRVDPRAPAALAAAVAFIALTPARIVAVNVATPAASDWQAFRQAAQRFERLLFIVAAGDEGRDLDRAPLYPQAFGLANLLVVTAARRAVPLELAPSANWGVGTVDAAAIGETSSEALSLAVIAATCALQRAPDLAGEALKRALILAFTRHGERPRVTRFAAVFAPEPAHEGPPARGEALLGLRSDAPKALDCARNRKT